MAFSSVPREGFTTLNGSRSASIVPMAGVEGVFLSVEDLLLPLGSIISCVLDTISLSFSVTAMSAGLFLSILRGFVVFLRIGLGGEV